MKSLEEFVCTERLIQKRNKDFIVICIIALLVSFVLLAVSAYFCYKLANPPAIIFTVFYSLTTPFIAYTLWDFIRIFWKESD